MVEQAQDVLTAVAAARQLSGAKQAHVIGLGEAGLWCLLAAAEAPQALKTLTADLNGFDPTEDAEFLERLNVPHLRRAGDLVAMAALIAPTPTLLHNLCPGFDVAALRKMYRAAGDAPALTARRGVVGTAGLLRWVTGG